MTVRRFLKAQGFRHVNAVRKPLLSERTVNKRKEFAKRFRNWTPRNWRRIIFSDEKVFKMRPGGRIKCWRHIGEKKIVAKYVQGVVQNSQGIMVWAAISGKGKLVFKRMPERVKSKEYQDTIRSVLNFVKPRYAFCKFDLIYNSFFTRSTLYRFQQDNAPVHKSRSTMRFLRRKGVRLFMGGQWPPSSPDMNIIEHIWPKVSKKLLGQTFNTKDELWNALKIAFSQISAQDILRLYDSLPSRLQALAEAKGRHTRY